MQSDIGKRDRGQGWHQDSNEVDGGALQGGRNTGGGSEHEEYDFVYLELAESVESHVQSWLTLGLAFRSE